MNDELNPPSGTGIGVRRRSQSLKGGLDPAEMGRRSGEVRRERARVRAAAAEDAAMTVRQRIGVALSHELTVDDWRAVIREARDKSRVADLARLADQAFGKSQPEEAEEERDDELRALTRAQRSAMIARLLEEDKAQTAAAGDERDPREAIPRGVPPKYSLAADHERQPDQQT